jgi:hypothetical protein
MSNRPRSWPSRHSALAAWLRATWLPLFALIAIALIALAALDIREVFHQVDKAKSGLAALASIVAILHLSAAGPAVAARQQTPP